MSFFDNPIANISGGISNLGKDVSNLTKNPLVDALAGVALTSVGIPGFLGPLSAGEAALTVGGISGLASGNIGQGLMAGLGAYGGASLYGDVFGGSATPAPVEQAVSTPVNQVAAETSTSPITSGGGYKYMSNPVGPIDESGLPSGTVGSQNAANIAKNASALQQTNPSTCLLYTSDAADE